VHPTARRRGVALALLQAGEAWVRAQGLGHCATWTSSTNTPLVQLYTRQGYAQVMTHTHDTTGTLMVKLQRTLETTP
jgi:GNAT superfamily N-acetyltransferase